MRTYQKHYAPDGQMTERAIEDAAFATYGLPGIDKTIEHIAGIAEEIQGYDEFLAKVVNDGRIIVPPDAQSGPSPGSSDPSQFREKSIIQRTKSLLLVLSREFEIDIHNTDELVCIAGVTDASMMRKIGYTCVDVPALERVVLICDEEGNATYIFDRKLAEEINKTPSLLSDMTKSQLGELIAEYPGLGRRVLYSKMFIPTITKLLVDIASTSQTDSKQSFLNPERVARGTTLNSLSKSLGLGRTLLASALHRIREVNGSTERYISDDEVEAMLADIESRGMLNPEKPDEWATIVELAALLDIHTETLKSAIGSISEQIGEPRIFKHNGRRQPAWSPEQQQLIKEYIDTSGYKKIPEGYMSVNGLAKALGFTPDVVYRAIKALDAEDELLTARGRTLTLSESLQDRVKTFIAEIGTTTLAPPEGVLSARQLSLRLNISDTAVRRAIRDLDEQLGRRQKYRFGQKTTDGFSEEQQAVIMRYLEEREVLTEKATDAVVSDRTIAQSLGVKDAVVRQAITTLGDSLGEVRRYKFVSKTANGYTEDQVAMIVEQVQKSAAIA